MKRLEEAARRIEQAVAWLERAVQSSRPGAGDSEAGRLAAALAAAKAENGTLAAANAQVAGRLDAAIARLSAVLGP